MRFQWSIFIQDRFGAIDPVVIGDHLRSGLHAVTERDGVIGREIVESERLNRGTLGFYVRRSCVD
jgi:hypothetical protein